MEFHLQIEKTTAPPVIVDTNGDRWTLLDMADDCGCGAPTVVLHRRKPDGTCQTFRQNLCGSEWRVEKPIADKDAAAVLDRIANAGFLLEEGFSGRKPQ